MSQETTQNIENATQRVRATRERCWKFRLEKRPVRNAHIDQIIKAIVEQNLRIENHDHVNAEEHLEHILVQEEVDRRLALRVSASKIEHNLFAFAPHGALNFIRASAHAIVTDIIFETDRFFANCHGDERFHRTVIAREQFLRGRDVDIVTEAPCHFDDSACSHPARGNERIEIRLTPVWFAGLMHNQLHQVVVIFALFPNFYWRDTDALFKNRTGIDRH